MHHRAPGQKILPKPTGCVYGRRPLLIVFRDSVCVVYRTSGVEMTQSERRPPQRKPERQVMSINMAPMPVRYLRVSGDTETVLGPNRIVVCFAKS